MATMLPPNPLTYASVLELDSAESAFIGRVRAFVDSEVLPNTRTWEENAAFPDAIWPRMGELGLLSMTLPKSLGGTGYSCRAYCEACREIAKGDPALAMNVAAVNALCVAHFIDFASDAQREKYLPGIVKGQIKL